jgi:hypothetical protein
MGVDVDPEHHRRADVIRGTGLADTRRVVVYEIALEVSNLLVREDDLRELADAGVDPIHDLASLDALVEKGATVGNPIARVGVQLDGFAVPGDRNDVFDGEILA